MIIWVTEAFDADVSAGWLLLLSSTFHQFQAHSLMIEPVFLPLTPESWDRPGSQILIMLFFNHLLHGLILTSLCPSLPFDLSQDGGKSAFTSPFRTALARPYNCISKNHCLWKSFIWRDRTVFIAPIDVLKMKNKCWRLVLACSHLLYVWLNSIYSI